MFARGSLVCICQYTGIPPKMVAVLLVFLQTKPHRPQKQRVSGHEFDQGDAEGNDTSMGWDLTNYTGRSRLVGVILYLGGPDISGFGQLQHHPFGCVVSVLQILLEIHNRPMVAFPDISRSPFVGIPACGSAQVTQMSAVACRYSPNSSRTSSDKHPQTGMDLSILPEDQASRVCEILTKIREQLLRVEENKMRQDCHANAWELKSRLWPRIRRAWVQQTSPFPRGLSMLFTDMMHVGAICELTMEME